MSLKNSVIGGGLMLIVFTCWFNAKSSEAFGTFGFDIHHRYSDTVKKFLGGDGLPEKGTADYFSAMAHRDRHLKARHLAATSTPILTVYGDWGNYTERYRSLGNLHYAWVNVGTPALVFLMAFDTGSDLFWLPCDCPNCARSFNVTDGTTIPLKIYSPSNSTTSKPLPCNSTMCGPTKGCSATLNACSYPQKLVSQLNSSANQDSYITPNLTFTMKGGSQFNVTAPTVTFIRPGVNGYCLAILKSEDINVIGKYFMEGYRLVFDREEMVLGWKNQTISGYDSISSLPTNSSRSRPPQKQPPPPPPASGVGHLSSMTSGLMAVIVAIFSNKFVILSS